MPMLEHEVVIKGFQHSNPSHAIGSAEYVSPILLLLFIINTAYGKPAFRISRTSFPYDMIAQLQQTVGTPLTFRSSDKEH